MNDRLLSAISLCRKAGKLKMGTDVVGEAARKKQAKLVLLASDVAGRTARQAAFACGENGPQLRTLPHTMEELSFVAGKRFGVLAVCDEGFANMIAGLLPSAPEEQAT